MANIPLQTRRTPPYAPLDRGDLQLLRDKSINPRGTSLAQEGQSLLEFAIVLPLFLLIAFGITEFGRAYYQYNTLSKAIRDGARYMSSHTYSSTEISNAQKMVVYGNTTGGGCPGSGCPVLPGLTASSITITPSGGSGPFNEGNPPDWITVQVNGYPFNSLVPGVINLNVSFSPQIKMRYVGPNARF